MKKSTIITATVLSIAASLALACGAGPNRSNDCDDDDDSMRRVVQMLDDCDDD